MAVRRSASFVQDEAVARAYRSAIQMAVHGGAKQACLRFVFAAACSMMKATTKNLTILGAVMLLLAPPILGAFAADAAEVTGIVRDARGAAVSRDRRVAPEYPASSHRRDPDQRGRPVCVR